MPRGETRRNILPGRLFATRRRSYGQSASFPVTRHPSPVTQIKLRTGIALAAAQFVTERLAAEAFLHQGLWLDAGDGAVQRLQPWPGICRLPQPVAEAREAGRQAVDPLRAALQVEALGQAQPGLAIERWQREQGAVVTADQQRQVAVGFGRAQALAERLDPCRRLIAIPGRQRGAQQQREAFAGQFQRHQQ